MDLSLSCPKCNEQMQSGFIVDHAHGILRVSVWTAGAPESSFWTGLKVEDARKITTYRCTGCDYLESYAPHENILE
jgi:hypothetical protein